MTEIFEGVAACPTTCDPDCDAVCHEDHVAGHKKKHWPYDCPASDRYSWGGSDFIAAAVKRLKAERDDAHAEAEQLRKAAEVDAAAYETGLLQIHADRDHWQQRAVEEWERAEAAGRTLAELRDQIAEAIRDFPGPNPSPADPAWRAGYREAQARCADIATRIGHGEAVDGA